MFAYLEFRRFCVGIAYACQYHTSCDDYNQVHIEVGPHSLCPETCELLGLDVLAFDRPIRLCKRPAAGYFVSRVSKCTERCDSISVPNLMEVALHLPDTLNTIHSCIDGQIAIAHRQTGHQDLTSSSVVVHWISSFKVKGTHLLAGFGHLSCLLRRIFKLLDTSLGFKEEV